MIPATQPGPREQSEKLLCLLSLGTRSFGIDTRFIREVLGPRMVHRVPLAPAYIAGIASYRGDVLATVSLRAVLGFERKTAAGAACVLVMEGGLDQHGDTGRFGLEVDAVGGVVAVADDLLRANPPPLSSSWRTLCCAAFRVSDRLVVQLDAHQLKPERLGKRAAQGVATYTVESERAAECEH